MITSIYEDKNGNIWFGANGGAGRYDGKSFRHYSRKVDTMIEDRPGKSLSDFSIGSNAANPIIEDHSGKFWFGTSGNTFIYDGKIFRVFRDNEGKALTSVWSIIEDKKGNIWLGATHGLWRYADSTLTMFSAHFVGYVYEDSKGNIWTSGRNARGIWALSRYDAKALPNNKPTVIEITQSRNLFGIVEVNDGSIWLGSFDGVYRYDGNTITDFKGEGIQQ